MKSEDFGESGNVDWDVSKGGISAVIVETNTATATGKSSVSIRYDTVSATTNANDTVKIEITKPDGTKKILKRTVFRVSWTINTNANFDNGNKLEFDTDYGVNTKKAEFIWDQVDGSKYCGGKVEAIATFEPTGINWDALGVRFANTATMRLIGAGPTKRTCNFERLRKAQSVTQLATSTIRELTYNDADWVIDTSPGQPLDGGSDSADCQFPNKNLTNKGFRIDVPCLKIRDNGVLIAKQLAERMDFREVVLWYDGAGWKKITPATNGLWQLSLTGLPNDCTKSTVAGDNTVASGAAGNIPNHKPVASVSSNQTIAVNAGVSLEGSYTDDDSDSCTYKWTTTAGGTLVDSDSSTPSFSSNIQNTYTITLKVYDVTDKLHHHKPTNSVSDPKTLNVTVQ